METISKTTPTTPKTPAIVTFEAKAETFKQFLASISQLVDEVRITADAAQGILDAKYVDRTHVAMGESRLRATMQGNAIITTGLDVKKLLERLVVFGKKDVLRITIQKDGDGGYASCIIEHGRLSRKIVALDPTGLSDPKAPKLEYESSATVPTDDLQRALRAAGDITDHVRLTIEDQRFTVLAEGDVDADTSVFDDAGAIKGPTATALYSLDYLEKMIKGAKELSEAVTLRFQTDMPLMVEVTAEGQQTRFLLAPRVESEER